MDQVQFYKSALKNLGVMPLLRLQAQKRLAGGRMKLTSKTLDHPVWARRGTSDASVFSQILIEDEYEVIPDWLHVTDLIVDLGANVGYSSAYFLSRFPLASVFAVEPDPGNFAILRDNLKPYRDRHITVQAAAWPRKERLSFNTSHAGQGNEWARSVHAASSQAAELIDTISIPDILSQIYPRRISLLKIDIEGAEAELFRYGADEWLHKVDSIVIELHGAEAEESFHDAIRKQNFRVVKGKHNAILCTRPKMVSTVPPVSMRDTPLTGG